MNNGNIKKTSFKNRIIFPVVTIFSVSILITSIIGYKSLHSAVENKTKAYLELFADNLLLEIRHLDNILVTTKQTLNEKHLAIARTLADWKTTDITHKELKRLASSLNCIEISIANQNGILIASSDISIIGFDYKEYEITSKYMGLLDGTFTEIAEEPRLSVLLDGLTGSMNHYVGVPLSDGKGFIQIGFNAEVITKLHEEINIEKIIAKAKIGRNGYGMVLSEGKLIASPFNNMYDRNITEEDWYKTVTSGDGFTWLTIDNERYFTGYKSASHDIVIGLVPEVDYYSELNFLLIKTILFLLATLFLMIVSIYMVLGKLLSPVKHIVAGLDKIATGDFDTRIESNYNDEFDKIKEAINSMAEHIKANNELALINENLKSLSNTDELTKLNNRRSFMEYMDIVWKQNYRLNLPITVMLLDIDFFKKYNDSLGHLEGDKALIAIAKCLKDQIKRETDFVARLGGEEFIYILPFVNKNDAIEFSIRLVENVEKMSIPHPMNEASKYLTVSVGIETIVPDLNNSIKKLLDNADKALYKAKQSGRNRSVMYINEE